MRQVECLEAYEGVQDPGEVVRQALGGQGEGLGGRRSISGESQSCLQVVNDQYSGWLEDLFTFCWTNSRTKRQGKQLADRIGNTRRSSKETKRATKKASPDPVLCALFWNLGCRNGRMWHNAYMPTSGSTWFNGAVEPLTQMMNCDCAS